MNFKSLKSLLAAGILAAPLAAFCAPADYIYLPNVEYGEKEIDFKAGSARKGADPRESAASIGFGYGAKEWWFTEIYLKYKRESNEGTRYDAIEWENKFQLTETGKYPLDIGFLLEIERPTDRTEGWEVKWGPLFQTEFGKWQFNANPLFRRSYRVATGGQTEFLYQWQVKYRWHRELEFGFQGFGETGKWNNWTSADERLHSFGPAIFGKLPLGGRQALKYNAAWLVGTSRAAPDHTLRLQVEYEF
jgi:hypothetical protein